MLQRYLLIWLVLLCGVAFWWPWDIDPFVLSKPYLSWVIMLAMFCVGSLLPADEITQVLRRWPMVLGGTAVQYVSMPLLAYLLGHLLNLPRDLHIGLMMVGCVPGAMASNILTLAAKGNVSYSVSLTTMATLLSPLVVPFALWLTLRADATLDPLVVSLKLLREVVGPVIAGHLVMRSLNTNLVDRIRPIAAVAANLAILWIIAVVVGLNRERIGQVTGNMLGGLLLLNLLGYIAGYSGARLMRLPEGMRRALTLEVGMQNAGVGTVLVLDLFADMPTAAIPTAVYTFGCMLTGTMLASWWGARSDGAVGNADG